MEQDDGNAINTNSKLKERPKIDLKSCNDENILISTICQ